MAQTFNKRDLVQLGDHTFTIEEQQRSCPYHGVTFKTKELWKKHHDECEVRIEAGYIEAPIIGHS